MASVNSRPESASRPCSLGSITRNVKNSSSDGLLVLASEPGSVKFEENFTPRPCSGSGYTESRSGSAGRTERKLLVTRKTELEDEPRTNSAGPRISGQQISDQMQKLKINSHKHPSSLVSPSDKININGNRTAGRGNDDDDDDDESHSSDSDSGDSGSEEPLNTKQQKVEAPLELKGEFLQAVMNKEYNKAQELCRKILLLEPDNTTCQEFHAVIVAKKKQDEENDEEDSDESSEDSDDDDDEDDDDDGDDDEEEEKEEDEDEDESEDSSEDEEESESDSDDDVPPGPLNLIMGGLPIRRTSKYH